MKTLSKIVENLFAFVTLISLTIGLIVALTFILSVIIGRSLGESMAIFSGNLMTWAIRLASIAVITGLINIYITKRHSLTIQSEDEKEKKTTSM